MFFVTIRDSYFVNKKISSSLLKQPNEEENQSNKKHRFFKQYVISTIHPFRALMTPPKKDKAV